MQRFHSLTRTSILKGFGLLVLVVISSCQNKTSDYERELTNLEKKIEYIKKQDISGHEIRTSNLISMQYDKACLTGDFLDYQDVESTIDSALGSYENSSRIHYQSALLNFQLHRIPKAKYHLRKVTDLSLSIQVLALLTDIAWMEGNYELVEKGYASLVENNPSWSNLSRLAKYHGMTGNPDLADRLLSEAAEQLTSKDMRIYGWIELQKGLIDLDNKRYPEALSHYLLANKAYSGYWLFEEHLAEIYHLLGQDNQSMYWYEKVMGKTRKPEILAAYLNTGVKVNRDQIHNEIEDLFIWQNGLYPEATWEHWIQYELSQPNADTGRLLDLVEKNHSLRPNANSKFLQAKVFQRLNMVDSLKDTIREIEESPWTKLELEEFIAQVKVRGATQPNY